MYNGIGLSTARGSGTNAYVQRNLSQVRSVKERTGYKTDKEIKQLEARIDKKPNAEILLHDKKRRVELKCMELQNLMEEQGYSEDEIEKKVSVFRRMLIEKEQTLPGKEDSSGRPVATETHQIAEMKEQENEKLRNAFGISNSYIKGSAFDPEARKLQREKEIEERNARKQQRYTLVRSPSNTPPPERSESSKKAKKKKKKRVSSSSEREVVKKKKKKKKKEASSSSDSEEERKTKKLKKRKNKSSSDETDSDKKKENDFKKRDSSSEGVRRKNDFQNSEREKYRRNGNRSPDARGRARSPPRDPQRSERYYDRRQERSNEGRYFQSWHRSPDKGNGARYSKPNDRNKDSGRQRSWSPNRTDRSRGDRPEGYNRGSRIPRKMQMSPTRRDSEERHDKTRPRKDTQRGTINLSQRGNTSSDESYNGDSVQVGKTSKKSKKARSPVRSWPVRHSSSPEIIPRRIKKVPDKRSRHTSSSPQSRSPSRRRHNDFIQENKSRYSSIGKRKDISDESPQRKIRRSTRKSSNDSDSPKIRIPKSPSLSPSSSSPSPTKREIRSKVTLIHKRQPSPESVSDSSSEDEVPKKKTKVGVNTVKMKSNRHDTSSSSSSSEEATSDSSSDSSNSSQSSSDEESPPPTKSESRRR